MASFLDKLKGSISKNLQSTHELFNKVVYTYLGEKVVWNAENDDTYIDKGYRYNPTIYSIINLISKTASNVPICIYQIERENDLARYKAMTNGSMDSSSMLKADRLRKSALIEINDTELHELLKRPNPSQSYISWIQELISFDRLTGNAYIYGIAPETGANGGKYKELYVLPSHKMEIHSGGIFEPIKEYSLSYNGYFKIPAEAICHIKDFNPYYDGTGSHLYGMSPLKAGLRTLQTNNEATTTGVKYLQNQTARGVLMSDEGDLSASQAQQLKDKFRQSHQGSNNAGDVVITPKKLSWINFGLTASDLSLIEQQNASVKELCNIYGVPVQLLNNTDSSTYNNMKEAKKSLYQNAVIPQLIKLREELNRWLVPKFGDNLYLDFDFSSIPELQEETEKVVDQMAKAWWISPNEKRLAMDYGICEEPEMDSYFIPNNVTPLMSMEEDYDLPELIEEDEEDLIDDQDPQTDQPDQDQDQDENHQEQKADGYSNYPQGATNNARRMVKWRDEHRDEMKGGTAVGWTRANQLANREKLSMSTIKRTYSFLSRHKQNASIDPKFKSTPWKDAGYVAYNLWGGSAMFSWAKRMASKED